MEVVRRPAARLASALLSPLVDATVLLSFDRTGYRVHSLGFREGDLDVDLGGKVCLVTGANAGIGLETARGLAERGARVWLLCRNAQRGEAAAAQLREEVGSREIRCGTLDVSERASVRAFAAHFPEDRVDALVHNAGVLLDHRDETSDGIERTFATNVLGPFLLTKLLLPRLERAAPARVVNVSSGGMYARRIRVDDLQWKKRRFDGAAAYAETKRAEVILTELWAERLAERGVDVHCMHPGWADTGGVRSSLPGFHRVMQRLLRAPAEGADTVLWLAASPAVRGESGRFWFDRSPRRTHWLPSTRESDRERQRLWRACERLASARSTRREAA